MSIFELKRCLDGQPAYMSIVNDDFFEILKNTDELVLFGTIKKMKLPVEVNVYTGQTREARTYDYTKDTIAEVVVNSLTYSTMHLYSVQYIELANPATFQFEEFVRIRCYYE
jgi:hypothetical protein